ncbi:MAG: hypothetical protein WAT62_03070 [Candidatus Nanogingivalis sp.]
MKAVVVYKENSDHAREVFDYLRDFERQTGKKLEEIDPEKRENIGFVETYDIVEYPTILALTDNGQVINMWCGRPLPTINEVSFYA